jgi:hypothetical protein
LRAKFSKKCLYNQLQKGAFTGISIEKISKEGLMSANGKNSPERKSKYSENRNFSVLMSILQKLVCSRLKLICNRRKKGISSRGMTRPFQESPWH